MSPRVIGRLMLVAGMTVLALNFALTVAEAQESDCFVVADAGGGDGTGEGGDAEDLLTRVDPSDADPATNETSIGTGTGTFNVESVALQPGTGKLYGVDGGWLGTFDLTTGVFSPHPNAIGDGSGSEGTVDFDNIDGLTFDPDSGALYGSERDDDALDLLVRIDPDTGALITGAFGAGIDYLVIEHLDGLTDIDDITIATTGTMYAIANENGEGDRLVTINPATGATTEIGPTGVDDMEGLTSAPGGALLGTTGKDAPDDEALWDIDPATGAAGNRRPLDNATDYEAVACPVSGAPQVLPTETERPEPDGSPAVSATVKGVKVIAETGAEGVLSLGVLGVTFLAAGATMLWVAMPKRSETRRS